MATTTSKTKSSTTQYATRVIVLGFLILTVISDTCSASSLDAYPSEEIHYGQPNQEPEQQPGHHFSSNAQQQYGQHGQGGTVVTPLSAIHSLLSAAGGITGGGSQGRSIFSALASLLPLLLSSRDETNPLPINIPELLRMVGVDSNKIGTMVINAIVYVIELVSNHFFGPSNSIDGRKIDSPTTFLLGLFDSRKAEKFLKTISNPDYPVNIINNLKKATGNDTACIQQLICKMSPFWWGVNRSVRDLAPIALGKASSSSSPLMKMGWKSLFMKYVPSVKEFTDNSNLCEARYNGCVAVAFANANQQHTAQKAQPPFRH